MLNKNVQEKYLDIVKTKEDGQSMKDLKEIMNNEKIPNFGKKEEIQKGFSTPTNNNLGFQYSSRQQVSPQISKPVNIPIVKPQESKPVEVTSNKSGFSDSLNKYIQRAYEKCATDSDFKKCKESLMKTIQAAIKNGDLHTRDFSKFPLPVLPTEEKIITTVASNSYVSEQERKNREKRKGRFAETNNNDKIKANIEELTKELKIVVL
jgi:hypothetical protein